MECVRNHRIECPGHDSEECCLNNDARFINCEVQMRKAIQAWLKCPAEKRPSCFSLGYRIQEIAMDFTREELRATSVTSGIRNGESNG